MNRTGTHLTNTPLTEMKLTAIHLTEDELDEILIADRAADAELSPASRAHLVACAECQARCAEFRSSLASFNQASLAWSEAVSNTLPRQLADCAPSRRWQVPHALLATVSAALLVAAGLTMTNSNSTNSWQSGRGEVPATVAQRSDVREQPAAAIAPPRVRSTPMDRAVGDNLANDNLINDNAMLHAIDSVLSAPEPAPVDLSPTNDGYAATHHLPARQGVND